MRHRMPSSIQGRDVRLEIIPFDGVELREGGIAKLWDIMHERQGDGKWWSIGRSMETKDIKRLYAGIYNRAWYAGYTAEMLEVRTSKVDGICFRWSWRAQDHPDIASNRAKRLRKHSKTVGAYLKRERQKKTA